MSRYKIDNDVPDPTVNFSLFTLPWNRHHALRWVLYGRYLGLKVEHQHDRNLTLRFHVIAATGSYRVVKRYSEAYDRWRRLKVGESAGKTRDVRDLLPDLLRTPTEGDTP